MTAPQPRWWPPVVLALAILVVLQPILTTVFAASDDYVFLLALLDGTGAMPLVMGDARPIHGLLYNVIGGALVSGIGDLWVFRAAFATLGWLAACAVWALFRRAGWSNTLSLTVALLYATRVQQVDLASLTPGHTVPLAAFLTTPTGALFNRA